MIKIYPVSIKVDATITHHNVDEFCAALKRAIAMLELDNDDSEEHPFQRLYDQSELDVAVAEALNERENIHDESSRIYARLASALRNGVDELTIGKLFRDEVRQREEKECH